MPLVGGGGAPNVAGGSNPAGTGTSLNYVGNLCYAYSGQFGESTSPQTTLNFTTGSELIRGVIQFNCFVDPTDPTSGSRGSCTISLDSQPIATIKADGLSETTPSSESQALIIPPFTTVTATIGIGTTRPTTNDFIMFSKDNKANLSDLPGYYAEVEMKNYRRDYAELFAVSSEVFESSK